LQQQLFRIHLQQVSGEPLEPAHEFAGGGSEVRINKPLFDYVVQNRLWYVEGQEEAFAKGARVDAPVSSKEIKAVWRVIDPSEKTRYHWHELGGQIFGLVALHLITKDIPAWTWATWEHVDNSSACKELPCRDAFGRSPSGAVSPELEALFVQKNLPRYWLNYRLVGTQVSYTDLIGRPVILGNSVIENGFVTESSCMTCHSRSTIGPPMAGTTRPNRLSVFPAEFGTPDSTWYINSATNPSTTKFMQLDFVWSFLRAKRRTAP
jgi:hypothetical protein